MPSDETDFGTNFGHNKETPVNSAKINSTHSRRDHISGGAHQEISGEELTEFYAIKRVQGKEDE